MFHEHLMTSCMCFQGMRDKTAVFKTRQNSRFSKRDKTADFKRDKTADFQNRTKQPIFKNT